MTLRSRINRVAKVDDQRDEPGAPSPAHSGPGPPARRPARPGDQTARLRTSDNETTEAGWPMRPTEQYSTAYEHVSMARANGIIEVALHTDGDSYPHSGRGRKEMPHAFW